MPRVPDRQVVLLMNHRYTQILKPIDRYVAQLSPLQRRFVSVLEGSLLILLVTSVVFYVA